LPEGLGALSGFTQPGEQTGARAGKPGGPCSGFGDCACDDCWPPEPVFPTASHSLPCPCVTDGQVPFDGCDHCRDMINGEPQGCAECRGAIRTGIPVGHIKLPSGMVRGDNAGKTDYLLVRDGPMYERWAELLSREAPRKGKRNWMNADSEEDLQRFRESATRHFEQWLRGDADEDHAAAVWFNMNGAEYVRGRLRDA
jgi:hypothetical protein